MVEDKQLIRQYAAERSEPAFAELVRRHLKMVYAAALRQVNGDTHLAEDVAQMVFSDFARKAKTLQHNGSIAGWLFVSTRFAAANAIRAEARRRAREQEVVAMNEINLNGNDGWNELRPLIDEALGELGETDRESIVLRYFQGYEFSLVGAALGVSENAARMRVDRALEKLRVVLQKRGLATTGAALGAALADSTGAAVPAQLAATITSAVLVPAGVTTASATPSILRLIAMNKLAGIAVGILSLSMVAVLVVKNPPKSEPQKDSATQPIVAKALSGQDAEPGSLNDSSASSAKSDAFQKAVQGHDAQVRARQEQQATNWFDEALKEVPGFNKFGAFARATLRPGETLVTGGWTTGNGMRTLVFVTPTWIDAAGNRVVTPAATMTSEQLQLYRQLSGTAKAGVTDMPPGTGPPEVTIDIKFAEVAEPVLNSLALGNLVVAQNKSTMASNFSDAQFRSLIASLEQADGSDLLSAPRVTTLAGRQCHAAVTEQETINATNVLVGPSVDVMPSLSGDGISVDLVVMALDIQLASDATISPATATAGGN